MDVKELEEIINKIINGEMSLRKAEEITGIGRESLKNMCMQYLKTHPDKSDKFLAALKKNKKNSTGIVISKEVIKGISQRLCDREITIKEAAATINIDEETLKEKIFQFLNDPENVGLAKRYITYQATIHPDYSHINFKALIVQMMKDDVTQTQIAAEYGIPARTISREIEKLKNETEYELLYKICKEYSYRKMQKKPFSQFELLLLHKVIDEYDNGEPIIVEGGKDKRRLKYEEAKKVLNMAAKINGTEKEKAKKLGVSVSTLRRYRIFVEQYEREREISSGR